MDCNGNNVAMPLTPIVNTKQRIIDSGSSDAIIMDVQNNYTDAEQVAYEEVASVISNKDDPTMPCLTFRVWFIGLLFSAVQAFIYQIDWYSLSDSLVIVKWGLIILLSFVMGKLLALLLPTRCWFIGSKYQFSLNPGLFSFKEHILIFVMLRALPDYLSLSTSIDIQQVYFDKSVNYITGIVFVTSLYFMVFGIAGKYSKVQKCLVSVFQMFIRVDMVNLKAKYI